MPYPNENKLKCLKDFTDFSEISAGSVGSVSNFELLSEHFNLFLFKIEKFFSIFLDFSVDLLHDRQNLDVIPHSKALPI